LYNQRGKKGQSRFLITFEKGPKKKKRRKGAFSVFAIEAKIEIEPVYTALQAVDIFIFQILT
jgi:hypothetical protein